MPFLTRPHFEDRQIVQYSDESISLSGITYIAPTILGFSGVTTGETSVTINTLTGYLNGQRLSGLVVEPAKLKLSGTTGTTTQNVKGFVLQSIDPYGAVEWAPLSGVSWSVSACTSPLYVSTIEACPNPTDPIYITAGNVQFGSSPSLIADITNTRLGIGTGSPSESLHIESGDILVQNSSGERFYSDMGGASGPRVLISADTNSLSSFSVMGNAIGGNGGLSMGIRGTTASFPGYGKQGDSFVYSSVYNNGLNIISSPTTGPQITDDYIRFYAGQDASGTIPDLHIQGSGTTRGNVGINTITPTEKLHIVGSVRIVDGTEQNGYVLTCDTNGVGSWSASAGGGGTFTGNTSGDCITDLYLTNLYGCSPITVHDTITYNGSIIDSATTNSFIFGDLHVLTGSTGTHGVDFDANVLLGGSSNRITPFQVGKHNTIIGGEGNKIGTPSRVSNSAIISSYNSIVYGSGTDGGNVIIGGKDSIISGGGRNVIVGGDGGVINSGVDHSVILGGQNITGTTDDTVYVPNLTVRGDYVLHSDEVLEVGDIPGSLESIMKGSYTEFNHNLTTANVISNSNPSGFTSVIIGNLSNYPTKKSYGFISYYNSGFTRTGTPPVGTDFNRGKLIFKASNDAAGMVINPRAGDPTAPLWFEIDGTSVMKLQGDGAGKATLGIAMSQDGTETASANLQIGGTGTTGTFKYRDGNQQSGYVLTSDTDGNASWGPAVAFTGNTSATCITDLYITNLYGCSPITVHDNIQSSNSSATGTTSFAFGENNKAFATSAFAFGTNLTVNGERSFAGGGIDNTLGAGTDNAIIGGDTNTIGSGNDSVIIGGTNNTIPPGIQRAVILGGQNITAAKSDTVYADQLVTNGATFDGQVTIAGGSLAINKTLLLVGTVVSTGNVASPGPTITGATVWRINLTGVNTSALPNGFPGQRLAVYIVSGGGGGNRMVITPATLNGYSTITLLNDGESVDLLYDNGGGAGWTVIGGNGYTLV
jgi:hypothetical protein